MKTYQELLRVDRRRIRSQALLAEILHIVDKHLSDDDRRRNAMRELHYELFDKFMEKGVEIVTDEDRRAVGLPERGPDGWTMEELVVLEQKRIEAMRAPISVVMPKGPAGDAGQVGWMGGESDR